MAVRQEASTGKMVEDNRAAEAPDSDEKPIMHVKVYSPFKIYYDQPAYSVSAENATGPFDVLPHHHRFITLLKAGEIQLRAPGSNPRIKISGGLMHVKSDQVTVFLNV